MTKFYIFHGWWSGPNDVWIPWLKRELENEGIEVIVPDLGFRYLHTEEFLSNLEKIVDAVDEKTYFVNHSAGCQLNVRLLGRPKYANMYVGGTVHVASFNIPIRRTIRGGLQMEVSRFNDDDLLNNLEETLDEIENCGEMDINWQGFRDVSPNNICIYSTNDPFINPEEHGLFKWGINARLYFIENAKHFRGDEGYMTFPRLKSEIWEMIRS